MIEGELITERAGVEALASEWERLAVEASNAIMTAAWVLAWLRHVAGPGTELRVVTAREGGRLIGIAPFYVAERGAAGAEHRLMGGDFGMPAEPLALPGRERELAAEVSRRLTQADPPAGSFAFGPMALSSPWAGALRETWPGRPRPLVCRLRTQGAPAIELREPSFDDWFQTLSAKLRRELRRGQRAFEAAGGVFRWSDAGTLRADAESFARLHAGRWEGRGWSRLADLGSGLPDWLEELGRPLIDQDRFGLGVLEIDGEAICVDLHLRAGRRAEGINVGWDQRRAKLGPAKLSLVRVVGAAYEKGCEWLGLGQGTPENKLRFANADEPAAWTTVLAPGPRLPLAYAQLTPALARRCVRERLEQMPEPWAERVKAAAGRLR